MSTEFESNVGSFQGDALSGKLFTLAGGLNHVRSITLQPSPPISDAGMPMESSYADDVDFLCPDMQELASMFDIIERVLKEWNLSVKSRNNRICQI